MGHRDDQGRAAGLWVLHAAEVGPEHHLHRFAEAADPLDLRARQRGCDGRGGLLIAQRVEDRGFGHRAPVRVVVRLEYGKAK